MIQIKKNSYVQPTEVREEVVQGICEAFLSDCCWDVYHPHSENNRGYRNAARFIIKHKGAKTFYGFKDAPFSGEEAVTFNGAEMKRAFEELIKAGYYMFKVWSYGTWMGYVCHDKPFYYDGYRAERVTSFDDRID